MPKVWNIGNTTVRNPKRIENALKVFVSEGFSGNAKGSETEARLHQKLKENSVLDFDGVASDINGRKWRAALYQLGFISYDRYSIGDQRYNTDELFYLLELNHIQNSYELTPAGQKLMNASSIPEIEELYTRQFVCYELPNALEGNYPVGTMKPFILLLEVLSILQKNQQEGLSKFETGVFLQKFRNHTSDSAQDIINEIIDFRKKLSYCVSNKEEKALRNYYKEKLESETDINPNSIISDYADTTFRYFSLSGLFSRIGQRLVIRANKRALVERLLSSEPQFIYKNHPIEYFSKYYTNSYTLPTDDKEFALQEIENLKTGIRNKSNQLLSEANKLTSVSDLTAIQQIRFQLIEYNNWEREEDFANEQQTTSSINDFVNYLRILNGELGNGQLEMDDKPAYLEWAVWRSFLSINSIQSPVYTTRRFSVDQDFYPRNTAPGGGADLIFEFETYILVVEVTLTTSHRQMAVESEPVRRHTVQYKEQFPEKDVYCLFIAPLVDNNVAETFRIGVWYKQDEEEFVNIVPMQLSDFISAIELLIKVKYSNEDFKQLLERCLIFRNVRAPQWKKAISNEIENWKKRLSQ